MPDFETTVSLPRISSDMTFPQLLSFLGTKKAEHTQLPTVEDVICSLERSIDGRISNGQRGHFVTDLRDMTRLRLADPRIGGHYFSQTTPDQLSRIFDLSIQGLDHDISTILSSGWAPRSGYAHVLKFALTDGHDNPREAVGHLSKHRREEIIFKLDQYAKYQINLSIAVVRYDRELHADKVPGTAFRMRALLESNSALVKETSDCIANLHQSMLTPRPGISFVARRESHTDRNNWGINYGRKISALDIPHSGGW